MEAVFLNRIRVKFCGMTRLEDARLAAQLGADAVGFIFYPRSARFVEFEKACEMASALPAFVSRVAVTVNPSLSEIERIVSSGCFDTIQFHGEESPESIRALAPFPCIKVVALPLEKGITDPRSYPVQAILVDKASEQRGGTGETVNWNQAAALRKSLDVPLILSGGLNENNLRQAMDLVQPYGIDVCSGIEERPGVKSPEKMKTLMRLCHT